MCCVTITIPGFEPELIPYESTVLPVTPYSHEAVGKRIELLRLIKLVAFQERCSRQPSACPTERIEKFLQKITEETGNDPALP